MISCISERARTKLETAKRIWWFLDYDGTLADFAPDPDTILPDDALINLVTKLAAHPSMRVTIISGRRLAHIDKLLPIKEILKAGSYGVEQRTAAGELQHTVDHGTIRPILDTIKAHWSALLDEHDNFFLEDKGWTIAIHAKDAAPHAQTAVLQAARRSARRLIANGHRDQLQLLGGHQFLEVAPYAASKKRFVAEQLTHSAWDNGLVVYVGDDDKDAVAFEAVWAMDGLAVGVGPRDAVKSADCHLPNPAATRRWLASFIA